MSFKCGIIGLPNTLSIRDVRDALSYVLIATVGNLIVEPPPAVNEDNADSNAAAAPGLNELESPPVTEPNLSIAPNADFPALIAPPTSVPENAFEATFDRELVTPPIPSAIALTDPLALLITLDPSFCPPGKLLTPDAIVLEIVAVAPR